jgi:hypothetical protein
MSPDEYIDLAKTAKEQAAGYLEWAEQETSAVRRARYLGYAASRVSYARWYVERAERIAA